MKRTSCLLCCFLLVSQVALAETPFQFSAPNLRAPDDPNVSGLRISVLHGKNRSVRGVDLGFLSLSETSSLSGFSDVFGMSRLDGDMSGMSNSLINVHTGIDTGVNSALINRVNTLESGVNIGIVNMADGYTMVDLGGVNVSKQSTVQLGFLNVTKRLTGFQFGFLNLAENGFLPMFPIFNFPKNQPRASDTAGPAGSGSR